MATIQQIRDAMHRQPFLGFTLHLTDGKSFRVKHPDFISVSDENRGRGVVIHEQGSAHLIDILHVVRVKQPPAPQTPAVTHGGGG
jgi:hypothetical protein